MLTYDQVRHVAIDIGNRIEFQYPITNGIGITRDEDGEFAIRINYVGKEPAVGLPRVIEGVKIIYRFEFPEIVAQ